MSQNNNLPWVEKYRPNKLDDIISHEDIINTLTNLITNNKIPHMIFYGPPGTGKTTTILACAKKMYGSNFSSMILELNGSDDRGINVVREQIKAFSATDSKISSMFTKTNDDLNTTSEIHNTNIKLVILDEADAMTDDAQFALRRVIELYTNSTRFCLICNYLTKIIPALQSRCQVFRFTPISNEQHLEKISAITKLEHINVDEMALKTIVELSEGDMRKSLNLLQSLHMIYMRRNTDSNNFTINISHVYKIIGYPSDEERQSIINCLSNDNLSDTYQTLKKIKDDTSLSNQDLIREMVNYYTKTLIDDYKQNRISIAKASGKKIKVTRFDTKTQNKLLDLFDDLAKIEVNLSNNASENIQLYGISSIINNYNNAI
jgi:replication factor C subunit 3/5